MSGALEALFWGLISGLALVIGALAGYYIKFSDRAIASVMAFGTGVLLFVLSFDLTEKAFQEGGIIPAFTGFFLGAIVYTGANEILARYGAKHRKRSNLTVRKQNDDDVDDDDKSLAIALGALLDGIPESVVIGLSLLGGQSVSIAVVIGIFLSNLPEGLSSATGMKKAGKSKLYIFGVWITIAVISGISAYLGYAIFGNFSAGVIASSTAFAGGAILCMIVDTMIPEAFAKTRNAAGIIVVIGFLMTFYISKVMSV